MLSVWPASACPSIVMPMLVKTWMLRAMLCRCPYSCCRRLYCHCHQIPTERINVTSARRRLKRNAFRPARDRFEILYEVNDCRHFTLRNHVVINDDAEAVTIMPVAAAARFIPELVLHARAAVCEI